MKKLENDPVIVSMTRTSFGKYGGSLSSIRPDDMLAHVISKSIEKAGIDPSLIDEVVCGCANQAGEDNRNVARMAVLLSGLNPQIPAITINRLCASGLDAIIFAARMIICKEAKIVIASGVESMSRAPYVIPKPDKAFPSIKPEIYDSSLGWRFYNPKMKEVCPKESNGETAERLAQMLKISRKAQDEYACLSHKRSKLSQKSGFFESEISPILLKTAKEQLIINEDECLRKDCNLEGLKNLPPSFIENGTVTAGNSSPLSDGAAAMLICSYETAKNLKLPVLARILGFTSAGIDPKIMGLGPVPATKKLCEHYGFSLNDFSSIEINEAFSAQVLSVIKELNLNEEIVNPNGGAISLGHPLGASGTRLVITLINHLRRKNLNLGLATLCVGVGQGVSMAIEAF